MKLSAKDDLAAALGHLDIAIGKLEMRTAMREGCFEVLKADLEKLHAKLAHVAVLIVDHEEVVDGHKKG